MATNNPLQNEIAVSVSLLVNNDSNEENMNRMVGVHNEMYGRGNSNELKIIVFKMFGRPCIKFYTTKSKFTDVQQGCWDVRRRI